MGCIVQYERETLRITLLVQKGLDVPIFGCKYAVMYVHCGSISEVNKISFEHISSVLNNDHVLGHLPVLVETIHTVDS